MVNHPQRLEANNALAAGSGLEPIRYFHDMVRELTTDGAPAVPEVAVEPPLVLAPWTPELDEAVRLAHNESFAGHWGSQPRDREAWQQWGVGHKNTRRDWCFVVLDTSREEDGRPAVAAYTQSNAYTQDWEAQGFTQGWTGLLGVRPDWRGRRLAPALLAAALRAFATDGMQKAGLGVDTANASGALRLYEGMGYAVEHTSVTWAVEGTGSAAG
jgi:ribosomal protein S18 acetylase RimI-like enzyme